MELAGHPNAMALPKAISSLPPFPSVVIRALQLVSTSEERLRQLHDLICTDPAFASELLKLANSPLYGISTQIKSTLQAAILMGYERLKGIVLTVGMRSYLGNQLSQPAIRASWRHSMACALIAEELATVSSVDKDVAYTAGIMHDIGRLALIASNPDKYKQVLHHQGADTTAMLQREREFFGVDHCQAGEALIIAWRLPFEFHEVTARHHEPPQDGVFDSLAVVKASCAMADALGFGFHPLPANQTCADALSQVQAHDRIHLISEPAELASRIAGKIHCMDSL